MPNNYRILIIDDDPSFHQLVRYGLRAHFEFEGADTVEKLWKLLSKDIGFDLILLDLALQPDSDDKSVGLALANELHQKLPHIPILIVTNRPDYQSATIAVRNGAKDYLSKESYEEELWKQKFHFLIENQDLQEENKELKKELQIIRDRTEYVQPPNSPLLGVSKQMEHIRKMLKNVADELDLRVLITGETGVGKGVAARFLHYNSLSRRNQPFEEVLISYIPEGMRAAILFGALKGTFTDAKENIKGRLHMADRGTVFLDEVGDLDAKSQELMLQFLQTKIIRPLGSSKDIQLDVQIVTATNKNLRHEIEQGRFREDLYQRLKVFSVEIPPLRERREDIMPLLLHFFSLSEIELNALIDQPVLDILLRTYDWVGNIRELENTVKSMRFQQRALELPRITMECLPKEILQPTGFIVPTTRNTTSDASALILPNALSREQRQAWDTLTQINVLLSEGKISKQELASKADFKSADSLLYFLKECRKKHSQLLRQFPLILSRFKTI